MTFLKLTTAVLGATAAITAVFSQPAEAQMYGYGNSYQQNNQPGRLSMPSQSGNIYRSNPPVMQQPNFGQQQRQPSQRGRSHAQPKPSPSQDPSLGPSLGPSQSKPNLNEPPP